MAPIRRGSNPTHSLYRIAAGILALVAPADIGAEGGVLLGAGAVIGAVEGDIADGGELGLDPVQPGRIREQEHQVDAVGGTPVADLGVLVRGEVVADFAVADAVDQPAGGQVEGGDHLSYAGEAIRMQEPWDSDSGSGPVASVGGMQLYRVRDGSPGPTQPSLVPSTPPCSSPALM
ncbi:hypothetical protein [Salinispora arenicola]|uniref:hypothetical protein n=1 Tax=Salinispora arenicola TaxID=168697 RepID=UPI00039E7D46|nr:hypothetical protein [Salinispora arenicola]